MKTDELKIILNLHKKWLNEEIDGVFADLTNANLAGANLVDADLNRANLTSANLKDADLTNANLAGANLVGADLNRANLSGAYLASADLKRANLAGVDLKRANLAGANLTGADLTGANLAGAILNGTVGNMLEIKSAQFDIWPITWVCAPEGVTNLQIGCQVNALNLWIESDKRWISKMDIKASDWWGRYRDVVLALVQASPAKPYGNSKRF